MEELQEAIVYLCASEAALMSKDTALSKIRDVQLWRGVLAAKKFHPQTELSNMVWSTNVAHFIKLYPDDIDRDCFYQLTDKYSLPIISADAALVILEQEHRICANIESAEKDKDSVCLHQRCVYSLVDSETGDWKVSHPHPLLEAKIGNIPRSMLESLLLHTIGDREKPIRCRDSVIVTGAGVESVNGVYTRTGLHDGCPMFTRSGTYKGDKVLFRIFKYDDQFFISGGEEDWSIESNEDIDFYATISSEEEQLPPDNGWYRSSHGELPFPTFKFIYA